MTVSTSQGRSWWWILIDLVILVYTLVPVGWILSLSLKPAATIKDGHLIPTQITWDNYRGIFTSSGFSRALMNSLAISSITTVTTVVIGSLAAYAIVRLEFRGKKPFILITLLISMFPQISLVTPLFHMERAIGIFDSWIGLIIPYVALGLPLAIYVLSAFFTQLPWELEKAAIMDGATLGQVFRKIFIPVITPGMMTAAILVFIFSWNDLLLGLSLTATESSITAPVAIAHFTGTSQFEEPTGSIAAGAMVITVPIIIMVILFQKKIVAGLTSGAVKG